MAMLAIAAAAPRGRALWPRSGGMMMGWVSSAVPLLLMLLPTTAWSRPAAEITAAATPLNLTTVTIEIVVGPDGSGRLPAYAALLSDRVFERARIRWVLGNGTAGPLPTVSLEVAAGGPADGYRIVAARQPGGAAVSAAAAAAVRIIGGDERGVLFGVGRLLRLLNCSFHEGYGSKAASAPASSVELPQPLNISSSPDYAMRGHQLGYRPKTNAYDGWDGRQYERYIEDLALFGTNLIELIPWSTDDVLFSPMFPVGPQELLSQASASCDKLGLSVGLWYPMKYKDYTDPATLRAARAEWLELLSLMHRLDEVQIPAGDPGSHSPSELLHATGLWSGALKSKFPNARLWLGPQEWSQSEMEVWWALAHNESASGFLDGLVYGPHTSSTLVEFTQRAPTRYPLRLYPDITHSLTTQFPVPLWDRALAITESRESINPRPIQYATIAALHLSQLSSGDLPRAAGFSSYSEGANDDVNKFVWSAVAWGGDDDALSPSGGGGGGGGGKTVAVVERAVREYANVFISSENAGELSQVIFGLEQAWNGSLLAPCPPSPSPCDRGIAVVNDTMQRVRALQRVSTTAAVRAMSSNWRWQQLQYRAMYDAHIALRLVRETAAETHALSLLKAADDGLPILTTVQRAISVLRDASSPSAASAEEAALSTGVEIMAGRLFESISMQLSVDRYFAEYTVRGANLDTLGLPLTNAPYLLSRLTAAAAAATTAECTAILRNLTGFADPGPGGFYDDLGDPEASPHLVRPREWADDPDYYFNPSEDRALVKDVHWDKLSSGKGQPLALPLVPVAWQTTVNTFYQAPLTMRYHGLEPTGSYQVEIVYSVPNIYAASSRFLGDGAKCTASVRGQSTPKPMVALAANGVVVHPLMLPPAVLQRTAFPIPKAALQQGNGSSSAQLELVWTMPPDVGGSGTGCFVAEVIVRKR